MHGYFYFPLKHLMTFYIFLPKSQNQDQSKEKYIILSFL